MIGKLVKVVIVLVACLSIAASVASFSGCALRSVKENPSPKKVSCNSVPEYWTRSTNGKPVTEIRLCFGINGQVYWVGNPAKPAAQKRVKIKPKKLEVVKEVN